MSTGSNSEPARKAKLRTLVLPVSLAIASILLVLFLRLAPNWHATFTASILMAIPIILLVGFYASVLISLATFREMQGTISGWLDVIALMVIEGVLAYLVFEDALYIAVVIALSCAFVAYLGLAQGD